MIAKKELKILGSLHLLVHAERICQPQSLPKGGPKMTPFSSLKVERFNDRVQAGAVIIIMAQLYLLLLL